MTSTGHAVQWPVHVDMGQRQALKRRRLRDRYGASRLNLGAVMLREADGSFLIAGACDAEAGAVREVRILLRLTGAGELAAMPAYPLAPARRHRGHTLNAYGTIVAVGH